MQKLRTVFGLAVNAQGRPRDVQFGGQLGSEAEIAVLGLVRLHEADLREVSRVVQLQMILWKCAACEQMLSVGP